MNRALGFRKASLDREDVGQVAHGADRVDMAIPERAAKAIDTRRAILFGLGVPTLGVVQALDLVQRGYRVRMIGTEHTLLRFECGAGERFELIPTFLYGIHRREIVLGTQRVGMIGPQENGAAARLLSDTGFLRLRTFLDTNIGSPVHASSREYRRRHAQPSVVGSRGRPEAGFRPPGIGRDPCRRCHCRLKLRLHLRLVLQISLELLCSARQDFTRGQRIATRLARIGHVKKPNQEIRHLLRRRGLSIRPLRFLIGTITLPRNSSRLDGHCASQYNEKSDQRRRCRNREPVSSTNFCTRYMVLGGLARTG